MSPNHLRRFLDARGLTLVKIPGTQPTWVVLGLHPTPTLTRKGRRWSASTPSLALLLRQAMAERYGSQKANVDFEPCNKSKKGPLLRRP